MGFIYRHFTIYRIESYLLLFFVINIAYAGSLERLFAPKAELWAFWTLHNASSLEKINHDDWDAFLQKHVKTGSDGINRVDYANILPTDKQLLQSYINKLENIPIRNHSRDEQLPYWINLYNAVTISIILKYYPVQSIRDINISPGFFSIGPWDKKVVTIENQALSLNDIEHRILRPIWKDPRLHYALNCASLGCPNLSDSAYVAATINDKLDMAARNFINHPRGVKINNNRVYVSSIYSWFQDDFGASEQEVINHFRKYASPELGKKLDNIHKIADDDYDWGLNDAGNI